MATAADRGSRPPVVLITEDNDVNRKLVRDLLSFRAVPHLEAVCGAEAFDLAVAEQPDVVLMDIDLPDMPGTAVLARLRADPRTAAIPVIAVTAFAMKGDAEELLAAGFDAYISKPIDVRSFVDEVVAVAQRAGGA